MSRSELKLYLKNMHSLDAPFNQLSSTALTKDVNTINEQPKNTGSVLYLFSTFAVTGYFKLHTGLFDYLSKIKTSSKHIHRLKRWLKNFSCPKTEIRIQNWNTMFIMTPLPA